MLAATVGRVFEPLRQRDFDGQTRALPVRLLVLPVNEIQRFLQEVLGGPLRTVGCRRADEQRCQPGSHDVLPLSLLLLYVLVLSLLLSLLRPSHAVLLLTVCGLDLAVALNARLLARGKAQPEVGAEFGQR